MALPRILQRKNTPLNTIQQDVSALEVWIYAPTPREFNNSPNTVILRMHIEETHLLEPLPSRIGRYAPDIYNPQAAIVVALIREAVLDVLVVIDGFGGRLVVAGIDRRGKRGDVEDISRCAAVSCDARLVLLVEFVVQEEVLHVTGREPALVRVLGAGVGSARDLAGRCLVGYVDYCELKVMRGQ